MTNENVDLSCLDTRSACDAGAEIELRHPVTNAGLGIFITVLGKDSSAFQDYVNHSINENVRKAQARRHTNKEPEIITAEQTEERTVEMLTVCTKSWRWGDKPVFPFQKMGSSLEELEFSVPNVKRVYSELPVVRKQIDEAIADLANFLKV
jgi:hypothetical protein